VEAGLAKSRISFEYRYLEMALLNLLISIYKLMNKLVFPTDNENNEFFDEDAISKSTI